MAVTDEAIVKIKDMLLRGELRPGDRLPPEKELSEALGLSRSSLREAVKALELIRVLDVRRGDGTFVTSLEPSLLLEAMSFVIDIHQDHTILDLFEVRRLLEPAAAAMATLKATPDDLERLTAMLEEVGPETSVEDLVAHDVTFHGLICELSGNTYLSTLLESLSGRTLRARIWRGLTEENSVERTLAEHRAIVDAMVLGNTDLVRSWVTVHISGVESWLMRAGQTVVGLESPAAATTGKPVVATGTLSFPVVPEPCARMRIVINKRFEGEHVKHGNRAGGRRVPVVLVSGVEEGAMLSASISLHLGLPVPSRSGTPSTRHAGCSPGSSATSPASSSARRSTSPTPASPAPSARTSCPPWNGWRPWPLEQHRGLPPDRGRGRAGVPGARPGAAPRVPRHDRRGGRRAGRHHGGAGPAGRRPARRARPGDLRGRPPRRGRGRVRDGRVRRRRQPHPGSRPRRARPRGRLARPAVSLVTDPCLLDASALVAGVHRHEAVEAWVAHVRRGPLPPLPRSGVWRLDLRSTRPVHPIRFQDELVALGSGPRRSRGCFWLPTRPADICVWDGAGGQVGIAAARTWGRGDEPLDPDHRDRPRRRRGRDRGRLPALPAHRRGARHPGPGMAGVLGRARALARPDRAGRLTGVAVARCCGMRGRFQTSTRGAYMMTATPTRQMSAPVMS